MATTDDGASPADEESPSAPPRSPRPDLPADLAAAIEGARRVLVLPHDNPDPDALASAFVLARVLRAAFQVDATVGYGGLIGRAENRAMVRELDLRPVPLEELDWDDFDAVAVVDTQPGFGNNSLPPDRTAAIVIDHHSTRGRNGGVALVDIRPDYGATSTILTEYATACDVKLSTNLRTALFYAIKSETQDLGREASTPDRRAYLDLLPVADVGTLATIQTARVSRDYFRAFRIAIERAHVYGRTVLTDLDRVENPDLVAEIADMLLRLEGADWACCLARHDDSLVLSLRTNDPDGHAGSVIREVVDGLGSAGGHGTMAGGRVPLAEQEYADIAERVRDRLLRALDCHRRPGEPLIL